MAKEIDQTFRIGDPNSVLYYDRDDIQFILNSKYIRRTANYYIIPDDALLDGV